MGDRKRLESDVLQLVEQYGHRSVREALLRTTSENNDVLTIVSNTGLHDPPQEFLSEHVFFASDGSIECDDVDCVNLYLNELTERLKIKLSERRWNRVILIPFGHVIINITIKMVVFRALWIETTDLFYFGNNKYGLLERDTKKILSEIK